ncbi:MAG: low specificity L-threonine aldolase, partial [Deltaproteobacteria bacterium]|nr:low specificity L-threonine aldolase [Deltaproteobacteria bacterium]
MAEYPLASQRPDQYGEGEHLQAFESEVASLLGHAKGLFFQSGTMAQLIAARIVTDQKQHQYIGYHPLCHLEIHEEKSYQHLHGLQSVLIGDKSRLITKQDLLDIKTMPAFVLLELPQREIGGQLPTWDELVWQVQFLQEKGVHVHLDGARLWECAPFYQKSYAEIASLFDSAYVSFYKGIGAIAGAALVGKEDFICQAKIWNRRHGGNLITAFPLYLAAKKNVEKRLHKFQAYYEKTQDIAEAVATIENIEIRPSIPQVNMFHLWIKADRKRLIENAVRIAQEKGIWGLAHVATTD